MFQEINPDLIKQSSYNSRKRWFRDAETECDLFLWQDEDRKLKRFQFWYQDALVEWDRDTGIRTGHVDAVSGSFVHYQSRLFRLHRNLDQEIISGVKELMQNKTDLLQSGMTEVHEILLEMASHDKK
jgi:hypothetical protein